MMPLNRIDLRPRDARGEHSRTGMLNRLVKICLASVLLFSSASSAQFGGPPIYVGPIPNTDSKFGTVMTRAVVRDPETDEPFLVEFNEDGTEAGEVDVGGVSSREYSIQPAADYRFFKQQLAEYKEQFKDTLAVGAELLSRREFEQGSFLAADNVTVLRPILLGEGVNSVLIRGQQNRVFPDPNQLPLLQFPYDLTQDVTIAEDDVSIVVNLDGQVLAQSKKTIGFRTGFFGDPNEQQTRRFGRITQDDTVFGPVVGTKVYVDEIVYRAGIDVSNNEGKYGFTFYMPLCPPGGFEFRTDVWSELRYKNLLPIGSPSIPYYLRTPGYTYCHAQLVPALLAPTIIGIQATIARPFFQSNLFADVRFVSGRIAMKNVNGQPVPIGETTYSTFDDAANDITQTLYDLNSDGKGDFVVQGREFICTDNETSEQMEIFHPGSGNPALQGKTCVAKNPDTLSDHPDGDLQGIFFDGRQDTPEEFPDLVRIIDQKLRFEQPMGVLKSISNADMRNTDVLFFREATGQLIMERRGLKEEESEFRRAIRYDEEKNEVAYRILLRGRNESTLNIGGGIGRASFEEWATANQLTEPFQVREADQPRPGEFIKIVAINRATGYTGTTRVQLSPRSRAGTDVLAIEAKPIVLLPPNLKIWAERDYEVEKGATKGDQRNYTIGSEGTALTSDKTVTIYTEWLDEKGRPLPDELGLDDGEEYGLTGRLAKVVGASALQGVAAGSDLAEFPIAPGRKTQVINVGDNLSTAEHFYVHVIGKPKDQECVNQSSCPSFDTVSGDPKLEGRPKLLTPFYVPLANEDRHWIDYRFFRLITSNLDVGVPESQTPLKPLPAKAWQYRPEYQFSQYELKVDKIERTSLDQNGTPTTENIIDDSTPFISSSDDLVDIFYSLVSSQQKRLSPVDGPQELVLVFGEHEVKAVIGADGQASFHDVENLALLNPDDYLSIRLYANNDAGNVLWEWAFYSIGLATDLNRDGVVEFGKEAGVADGKLSDKTSADKPFRFWLNNDYDVVNDTGNIDLNREECPDFTGNQVCEQWDEDPAEGSNTATDNLKFIESQRDLEDFAPLAVTLSAPRDEKGFIEMRDGTSLEIKAVGMGLNLFKGDWLIGTDYLTDQFRLEKQMENQARDKYLFKLAANTSKTLTKEELKNVFGKNTIAKLIFEGTEASDHACAEDAANCYLELSLKKGGELVSSEKLYMALLPVKHYYEHYTAGRGQLELPRVAEEINNQEHTFTNISIESDPKTMEQTEEYVMMVHGWRMQFPERVHFAETAFKRLYWSGYRGKFGFFSWPTGWFDKPAHFYPELPAYESVLQWLAALGERVRNFKVLIANGQNYNRSEVLARVAGNRLDELLDGIDKDNVHIFAHSMGNVVVSEALRNANGRNLVKNYVASQAAEVAGSYNAHAEFISHAPIGSTIGAIACSGPIDGLDGVVGPEDAWRCYNTQADGVIENEFDMPPNHYSYTIPSGAGGHGPTSPELERVVAREEGWGPSYYRQVDPSVNIINFHNRDDEALRGWEFNQLTKPDAGDADIGDPQWRYERETVCAPDEIICDPFPDFRDETVTDEYFRGTTQVSWSLTTPINSNAAQILAHATPSRNFALGQRATTGEESISIIDDEFALNLNAEGFGSSNQGHSAQYYNTYESRSAYWVELLDEFGLGDE